MKLVIIECPLAKFQSWNSIYACAALHDSLSRGEAPLVPYLLYTQPGVLDDLSAEERLKGISAGDAWLARSDVVAVYDDLGVTPVMGVGITAAETLGVPVEYRQIEGWPK